LHRGRLCRHRDARGRENQREREGGGLGNDRHKVSRAFLRKRRGPVRSVTCAEGHFSCHGSLSTPKRKP
jgi:hypothetical protein